VINNGGHMNIKQKLARLVGSKTGKLKKKHLFRLKSLSRLTPDQIKKGVKSSMQTLTQEEIQNLLLPKQ
jgi:hypothetical protein